MMVRATGPRGRQSGGARAVLLTPRELDYLRLRALGMTREDVAREWGASMGTVLGTLTRVHRKLDVTNLVDALRVVGWLQVPD